MLGCGRGQAAGPGCWPFPVAPRGSAGQRGAAGRDPVAGPQIQAPPLAGLGGCFASRSLSFFINKTGTARECKGNAGGAAVFLSPVGDRSPEGRAAWGVLPFWPAGITFAIFFVPGWTSCPDQRVFTQERPRSLTVCGRSPRQAGWPDTHVSQSSQRIGAVFGASGPTAGGQGAWAPWALAATSGGRGTGFLGAPLSIPATQLSTCTG